MISNVNMTFHKTQLNCSLPQCPHDEIVLSEPFLQNNHFHWVHRRRVLDSPSFWLRLWVVTWFSPPDRLHKYNSGSKDAGNWSPCGPAKSLKHAVGAGRKCLYTKLQTLVLNWCTQYTRHRIHLSYISLAIYEGDAMLRPLWPRKKLHSAYSCVMCIFTIDQLAIATHRPRLWNLKRVQKIISLSSTGLTFTFSHLADAKATYKGENSQSTSNKKMCGQMRPRPSQQVVWVIVSQSVLVVVYACI